MGVKKLKPVSVASMDCLPDELLVQILYFLPTKEAVSTSVLSKRWRNLFTFSQYNLDIDYSLFWQAEEDKSKSFWEFVDRTLALQGGNRIKTYSVKFKGHDIDAHGMVVVKRWICNGLKDGVSELHLWLDSILGPSFDFPSKVFTSTTLVKLSLGRCQHIPSLPSNTYLPALKVLFLGSVWFEDDQLSDVFLAACPTLEDLTIHHKTSPKVPPKIISSKTIKRLSVTINFNYSEYDYDYIGMISLDIPSVVDLYYSGYCQRQYARCNFDSLVKATLDLHFMRNVGADVTNLISGICNVKALSLTSSAVKDLDWDHYACRKNHYVWTQIPPNNQIKMLSIIKQ